MQYFCLFDDDSGLSPLLCQSDSGLNFYDDSGYNLLSDSVIFPSASGLKLLLAG